MDMDLMDMYRRPYAADMAAFGGHPHGPPQGQQFAYWPNAQQQFMAFYHQQNQRAAAVMMQGNLHPSKQTEPKPRLAKDEVELLEREFIKNPKPNSSTKRELAEQMGVEVPRINNWFQNRRAKEKQMRRTREFESQQARERAASESTSPEDQEQDQGLVSEFYALDNRHQPLGLSSATLDDEDEDLDDEEDREDAEPAHEVQSRYEESCHQDISSATPSEVVPDLTSSIVQSETLTAAGFSAGNSPMHSSANGNGSPASISHPFDAVETNFQPPVSFPFGVVGQPRTDGLRSELFNTMSSQPELLDGRALFDSYPGAEYLSLHQLPTFPSQMLPDSTPSVPTVGESSPLQEHQIVEELAVQAERLSPLSASASPPALVDTRFKSPPPPADIAGRRNMRRPPPLGLNSLRNISHHGPKTGIDMPRRPDAASPMRRIASATGSLSGRIQKNGSGPRSPFIERNKEALMQNLQITRSPILNSINSALSPLTPEGVNAQAIRETTVATSVSDDEQGYTFGPLGAPFFKVEHTIKTPPDTPGLPVGFQDHLFQNPVDQPWNFVQHDEPLPTPSLCSHSSELDFSMAPPMPSYVASQPVTPSFPPSIGPTYNGFFTNGMASGAEYTFPDSCPTESSARSSPGQPKSKQMFQFAQNITPQDFNAEK